MTELDELASECVAVLSMLISLYEKAEISKQDFMEHTKVKIDFLSVNIEKIKDPKVKSDSQQLQCYYANLMEKNASSGILYNTRV